MRRISSLGVWILVVLSIFLSLAGCGSGEEAPTVGDAPAAAGGVDANADPALARDKSAVPRSTLPSGTGRGGTVTEGGVVTR